MIDKVFPLSGIEDAYRYLNSNGQIGKIVVAVPKEQHCVQDL